MANWPPLNPIEQQEKLRKSEMVRRGQVRPGWKK